MDEVLIYLKKLLNSDDILVVATSGGPDSMCLLHLLCELKEKLNLKIIVAHVNHKLRCESEEEALFVKNFSLENHLIYEYMEIKEYNHDNLENDARNKRYQFFNELVKKYHANYLFTAHHGDDLIETIMMRLVRGSSIKGYSGFKKIVDMDNYKIIRPFITITKEDILDYMDSHHYKYYVDESNYSREYTRNRYRMDILPFLKKENPMVHLKFLKFSEELTKVNEFFEIYLKELLDKIEDEKGIYIPKLLELDSFLIKKIIEYQFRIIYVNDLFLVSDKNTDKVIELIGSNKSNGCVSLPNGYLGVKEYNYFKIVHNKKCSEFSFVLEDEVIVPTGIIRKIDNTSDKSNYTIRINSKDITLPIIIRNRRNGDKIAIKNLNGSKKVKDIFINEKIPVRKREVVPIVCDSKNEIHCLPFVKKSKFDVETNGIYDIILSYEEEKNEY